MGVLISKNGKKHDSSKDSAKLNKKHNISSIKEGFKILTKQEVESERSRAYEYVL